MITLARHVPNRREEIELLRLERRDARVSLGTSSARWRRRRAIFGLHLNPPTPGALMTCRATTLRFPNPHAGGISHE
jgi:hypothetical protein